MSVSTGREDVDTWAPVGWVPGGSGFDEAPFGSVLGDPLMGSPLFDVAVLDDASEHRLEDRETVRGGRGASAEGAQADPAAVLRAQVEEQVRAMRRGVPQGQQVASRTSGYGRAPGVRPGAAASGQRPQGAQQSARMPVQQPVRVPAQQPVPVPQSPYSRRPGPPGGYGGGYGGRPGQPVGYGGGPGVPVGYGGGSGASGWPPGSGLPRRPPGSGLLRRPVGSGRPLPAGADPYASPGVYGRPGGARPPQPAGPGQRKSIGPYLGWIIFFLFLIIWHIVR